MLLDNQVEILQTLDNYTFAAHFESDDFLQKGFELIKKQDSTKNNRMPAPWKQKFKCSSLDTNNYLYMDERLVIPKTLRPIFMRTQQYEHSGRDSMLATVSHVL